jgi:muconolactone delta-isomerase
MHNFNKLKKRTKLKTELSKQVIKYKMNKFMIDILLQGIDNETRLKLLPKEQEIIKEWEDNGTLLASYIKGDTAGIYLVLMANDKSDADQKLSTLPYYPYMKIEIMTLR